MPNYSFQDPNIPDGSVIDDGNFTQMYPDTEIMAGKTLTINGGNFCNVKPQPEWTINGGFWIGISFCSHLHPGFISRGLQECGIECNHMISKEKVTIDGNLVDIIYVYGDTIL